MIETDSLENPCPNSWLAVYPWLKGAAKSGSTVWWDEPVDEAESTARKKRLATIAELAMERLTQWTIGEIFPGLPPDVELASLELPVRAMNALSREGCVTAGDLTNVTIRAMLAWPTVGVGTVDAILQALADVSTEVDTPNGETVSNQDSVSEPELPHQLQPPEKTSPIFDDLTCIARWYAISGLLRQPLLTGELPPGTPNDVLRARQHLSDIRAEDVLSKTDLELDVARVFDDVLGCLDHRASEILNFRLFADKPVTLEDLGLQYGLTRERIRQIEGKARGVMLNCIAADGPLALVADAARTAINTICTLSDLLLSIPALEKKVEKVGQPAWRVLDRLDDAYEIENGWCAIPSMNAAQLMTQTQLQEQADKHGVVRIDDLFLINVNDPDRRKELTLLWLKEIGYIVDGDYALMRTQRIGDYAAAVLSLNGSPMSAEGITERFAFQRSPRSLRNAMNADDRFERVDRDRFALTEWGMEAYSGIRSLIREQVVRSGGGAKLNDIIESITGRYSVSATSVLAYASSPPFENREGIVRLVNTDRRVRKTPDKTRRLFRHPDAWAYRFRVSQDHLRGSGSFGPMAIASILNLRFGETRELESPLGPVTVGWTGSQPSFGTIRRFLMSHDIAADTDAFLLFYDNGNIGFEPTRECTGNPILDVVSLIGAPATTDRDAVLRAVSLAIGVPETTPVTSIIGAYKDRGDNDIVDLLTSARNYLETAQTSMQDKPTAAVEEILDLL